MTKGPPLIVTRPEPGNAATVRRARALGFDVRALPLFAAKPVEWAVPPAGDFDALLLTSAFAPRLAGPGLNRMSALPVHAVGDATARAAMDAGLTIATVGSADAQSLVDAMAARNMRSILWLCGRDRSQFDARGIKIAAVPCYAVDLVPPSGEWHDMIAAPAILLAHSVRAARHIADLAGEARAHLTLVAISPAVAAAAGDGWRDLAIAGQPDDAGMLAQAHSLWHKAAK
ncbi:MAG: uroporphyrinogen-III synthase [Sphingopyxis sp.]|nr:uroporphyrinogen-III synthase [Sphingopyxis sp.]